MAALFKTCPNLETAKMPSVGAQIKQLWSIQTERGYSALKIDEPTSHKEKGGSASAYYSVKEAYLSPKD